MLLALQEFEEEEDYKACQFICDAITFINNEIPDEKDKFPTVYSDELLEEIVENVTEITGTDGTTYRRNLPAYVRNVKKDVLKEMMKPLN